MADSRAITGNKSRSLNLQTQKISSPNKPSDQAVNSFNAQSLLNNKSTSLARDAVANKLSEDTTLKNTKVAETEKVKKTKKIFVKHLASTGANRVNYTFIGGRHIHIEAKAGAAFGHEGFAYKVKSFEYDNGGHRIPHMEAKNSTIGSFVVNTMNYGLGSTSYSQDHISPVNGSYAQKNFVEWTVSIPPQTSSNYNSSGFSLNVYQIVD